MRYFFVLCLFLFANFSFNQSELLGKYKVAEGEKDSYDGFVLFEDGEAFLLKAYSKKYLYDRDLPKDNLSLYFNPGLDKVKDFPVELRLVQPIKVAWTSTIDTLIISDNDLKVVFRKYKTSFVVVESHMAGFSSTSPLMYFKFEGFDEHKIVNSKIKILSTNKDEIPSNYDLTEYFTDMPSVVLIKTPEGTLIDSLDFEFGQGEKTIIVATKASRGKDNLFSNYAVNIKRVAGYFYNEVHGYEYLYYSPNEITDVVTGKKFLLKREGWYEQGVKHGKWLFYNKVGELTKTEIWKKGKLVNEK